MKNLTVDLDAVRELALYAENKEPVYRLSIVPTMKNLARKIKKGTYDADKAIKTWEYVAEFAAKLYAKDFASPNEWHIIFPRSVRTECAKALAD